VELSRDTYLVKSIDYSLNFTDKRLLSGRQYIWEILMSYIYIHPIIGYGSGTLPREFINMNLSAHNLYIQIALQVGLSGLFIFIMLLRSIWLTFYIAANNPKVRLAGAFFIGILANQSFEVGLIQNNLSDGLISWLILGIGCYFCYKQNPV